MTYRDEREALHNQVSALQEDLAEAKREAAAHDEGAMREKAAALEAQVQSMRAELGRMEGELEKLRVPATPPPKKSAVGAQIAGVVAVLSIAAGIVFVTNKRATPPPTSHYVEPVQARPPEADPMAEMKRRANAPPTAIPPPPPTAMAAAEPPISTRAHFTARVTKAQGVPVAPGSTCSLDATIRGEGEGVSVSGLEMTCGKKKLYSADDPLNGMSMLNTDATEKKVGEKVRFGIVYSDKGTRGGSRNQIEVDSKQGIGVVFGENLPAFRIEFTLPHESDPQKPGE